MIKLIVTDLDETLLRTDKTISVFTKNVLHNCREKGIKVIYATGRGGGRLADFAPTEMFDGRIVMNGAVAYSGEKLIYSRTVKMDLARDLLIACNERGLKTAAQSIEMHYSNFDVTSEWASIKYFEITDFRHHNINAEKLYAVIQNDSDVEFIKEHIPTGLYLTVSRDKLAQIMHVEATKMKAIGALADYWGIKNEEIVSFGDDLNDIDMLSGCGTGVAMENALAKVKAVADEICAANDDDGVAKWIEKQVLTPAELITKFES